MNYQRKAVPVHAWQWDGHNHDDAPDWVEDKEARNSLGRPDHPILICWVSLTRCKLEPGDWLVYDEPSDIGDSYTDKQFHEKYEPRPEVAK